MANSSQSMTFLTMSATLASSLSRSSVSEVAADTSSRKSSSSERSRKRTADLRGVAIVFLISWRLAGSFDDLYAGAGADAAGACGGHFLHILQRADPARSLHAHIGADHEAHQRYVMRRRAAGAEAGGRLHEIRACQLGQRAGGRFLIVVKQRRLEDHL